MKRWTKQAEERLEEYLAGRVRREGLDGDDARELREDLRAHVQEEAEHRERELIDGAELDAVLAGLDDGSKAEIAGPRPIKRFRRGLAWTFGVVFPAAVVVFEALSGFCGGVFFDPLPTVWHGLLALLVPAGNAWLLSYGRRADSRLQGWTSGIGLVVSAFYVLLFLPLLPASVLAVLFMGMGLLSLTPIFAWIATWRISRHNRGEVARPWSFRQGRKWGMLAALGAILILEGPGIWTRVLLDRAVADPSGSGTAMAMLRAVHSERALLKACYEGNRGTAMATDIAGWLGKGWGITAGLFGARSFETQDSEAVREVFFRVTGKPFNSLKPPRGSAGGIFGGSRRAVLDDWEFDDHLGGDDVAVRLRGLDLAESRFDGHVDGTSAIGYGEWTMVFDNHTSQPKEARCQVRLPRDGRVSRLTLWVNGEPREAAFNSVAKVKAAYREVAVQQRRDPVLVTMAGPDTVMVQCFPVPAHGEMKIRFGVTAPCEDGAWELPRIVERNFGIGSGLEHALWMQADRSFTMPGLPESRADGKGYSSQSGLPIQTVLGGPVVVELEELGDTPGPVWCRDRFTTGDGKILCRTAKPGRKAPVDRVVVVIDGSETMAEAGKWIRSVFSNKTPDVLIATDGVTEFDAGYRYSGGRDNEAALRKAIGLARDAENGAVVWLHGPQPVRLTEAEALRQMLERGTRQPEIHEFEVVPGPNRLADELGRGGLLQRGPRLLEPARDLKAFLDALTEGRPSMDWSWERQTSTDGIEGREVWDQLARHWAMEHAESGADDAPKIAAAYQLVTPVSGAVVLETMEQFERHGLKPVEGDASSIPAIPEPSTSLLLLIGMMTALLRRRR